MVKHIVIWELASAEDKQQHAQQIKEKLEALRGKIPGLLHIEVGIDCSHTVTSGDIVLYSEFENKEALAHYQAHPLHVEAGVLVRQLTCRRQVVDYTIG